MPLTPALPAPLPLWNKTLIKATSFEVVGEAGIFTNVSVASAITDVTWNYSVARWSRPVPATTTEDYAQVGINVAKITAGDLVKNWGVSDHNAVLNALATYVSAFLPQMASTYRLVDFRAYMRSFNPDLPVGSPVVDPTTHLPAIDPSTGELWQRFARSGPPALITPSTAPGTGTGQALPHQTALSITFKTAGPKHWGRIYMPSLVQSATDTTNQGRWTTAIMTAAATAAASLVSTLQAGGYYLVVPNTQQDGKFAMGLSQVTSIQVDDIPDVIRRRRPKHRVAVQTRP